MGAFFQRFALVVGGKGEAEFVGKAEAVAEVEAVADDGGSLLVAVDYGVVGMLYAVAFLIELLFELREGGWVARKMIADIGVDFIVTGIDSVVAARMAYPAFGNFAVPCFVFGQFLGNLARVVVQQGQDFIMVARTAVWVFAHGLFAGAV